MGDLSLAAAGAAHQHVIIGMPPDDWLLQQALLLETHAAATGRASIICDEAMRVRTANAGATALLAQDDGLALRNGCLSVADSAARQRLRSTIERALGESGVAALLIRRRSQSPAYQAVIRPLLRVPEDACTEALWMIVVSDPRFVGDEQLRAIATLYDLTPAETRLAEQLMLGATVDEAAAAMTLSVATIRSQLSSILRKAGARRQAELVRLFSAVPA